MYTLGNGQKKLTVRYVDMLFTVQVMGVPADQFLN
jgi:hypothetical protein